MLTYVSDYSARESCSAYQSEYLEQFIALLSMSFWNGKFHPEVKALTRWQKAGLRSCCLQQLVVEHWVSSPTKVVTYDK